MPLPLITSPPVSDRLEIDMPSSPSRAKHGSLRLMRSFAVAMCLAGAVGVGTQSLFCLIDGTISTLCGRFRLNVSDVREGDAAVGVAPVIVVRAFFKAPVFARDTGSCIPFQKGVVDVFHNGNRAHTAARKVYVSRDGRSIDVGSQNSGGALCGVPARLGSSPSLKGLRNSTLGVDGNFRGDESARLVLFAPHALVR